MKTTNRGQEWVLLIHQLPPHPTNLRVRTWRKLQKLGALAIKNSVYVLPFSDKTHEDFQWLKQEIESLGGEATVFRGASIEGATDKMIIALFRKTRDEEYAQLIELLDRLNYSFAKKKVRGKLLTLQIARYETELDKLHSELERIVANDFFFASGRKAALAAYKRCQRSFRNFQGCHENSPLLKVQKHGETDITSLRGRRWVTRRDLFVDRLAAIWLVKRFVDPKARFLFVADGENIDGAIGFDMYGGEFTHRGEDCTFETMIAQLSLSDDSGLRALAEIVHDIDLKDNKFNRTEAAGVGGVIRGLADTLNDDRKLAQQCLPIFDGLYDLLGRENKITKRHRARRS